MVEPFPPPALVPTATCAESWRRPCVERLGCAADRRAHAAHAFYVQFLVVVGARRFAYPHESWFDVAQKPVLALLSQFLTYAVVALYMILLVEGKYHARFWQAIRWNWPGDRRSESGGPGRGHAQPRLSGTISAHAERDALRSIFRQSFRCLSHGGLRRQPRTADGRTLLSRISLSGDSAADGSSSGEFFSPLCRSA